MRARESTGLLRGDRTQAETTKPSLCFLSLYLTHAHSQHTNTDTLTHSYTLSLHSLGITQTFLAADVAAAASATAAAAETGAPPPARRTLALPGDAHPIAPVCGSWPSCPVLAVIDCPDRRRTSSRRNWSQNPKVTQRKPPPASVGFYQS